MIRIGVSLRDVEALHDARAGREGPRDSRRDAGATF